MGFKNPLTVAKLSVIKAQMYIKTLTIILKTKLQDGDTAPFSIITNHVYNGFDESKSEKIPFFLVGTPKDGETTWKKFRETTVAQGKKQKDFMVVGECTRSGNTLFLTLNKSKGMNKLPKPVEKRLNALLNKIIKGMTVQTKGVVESGETEESTQTNGTPTGATPQGKNTSSQKEEAPKQDKSSRKTKEEAIQEFKEEKVEEAKELSENIKKFRELFDGELQVVVNNVKKGQTTKKDAKVVKETTNAYDSVMKVYRKTAKQVQKKFKKAYDELQAGKRTLFELAVATKGTRKSLAQIVADTYFEEGDQRPATKAEVAQVQKFIKEALKINRTGGYKAPQAVVIRAVSYVMKEVGIDQYQDRFVEQVLQKRQAA